MKKLILLLCLVNISYLGFSQVKGIKELNNKVNSSQNAASAGILKNLDEQLKSKFSLDAVKSELVGNVLNIKAADTDFAKLSAGLRTNEGQKILTQAKSILGSSGFDAKGLNVKEIVLEMLPNLNAKSVLQTLKFPL